MGRAEQYFSRPSFSAPAFVGKDRIAFLDDRSGTTQVSVLTVATGEIEVVTSYEERVLTLKGSSRSGRVLFGMDVGGNERQQLWTMHPGGEPLRLTHADSSIHEPGAMSKAGDYVLYRSNARDESTFDIVGVSLEGGEPEIWLKDGGQVSPTDINPGGERALVISLNGNMDADVLLVSRTGDVTNLTTHEGEQWVFGASFDSPGTGVWLLSNLDREFVALMHLDIASREHRVFFETDWDIEHFKVSPDGSRIVLSINEDAASTAVIVPVSGNEAAVPVDLPRGAIDQFAWSPDSSTIAFGLSTVEHPSVIMVASLDGSARIVADTSRETGTALPLTFEPQTVRYRTFDDREIPAFFFKPSGKGPFPVLVDIHGGPESQRRLNYSPSGPVLQYLTSLGMAVLSLNVRGSTGYGKEYSHLDDKAKRLDSVKDVEYAVGWLRNRDDIDSDRIAVYGRSYGGFMTLASLVFYPDLWAAGVDMVGIANFVSFLERTGPWRRAHREAEYGELANDREMLERISPLNHIDNIVAPLLVVHGRNDPRVPLFEAEQIVEALKARGQEVELRVYDNEGHALSKRPNVLDAFALMGAFLTEHLQLTHLQ
jgi:dipeptidyl aminopeptidase/acylaminoacyl peptidase